MCTERMKSMYCVIVFHDIVYIFCVKNQVLTSSVKMERPNWLDPGRTRSVPPTTAEHWIRLWFLLLEDYGEFNIAPYLH